MGSTNLVYASVSPSFQFQYDDKNVRVKIYDRDVGDSKNHAIFKYGDLIQRAIQYKSDHPETDVHIKFAIYKIGDQAFIGINPNDSTTYAYVRGHNFGGSHTENLVDLIVKAALNEVYVDFVYHKENTSSQDIYGYIDSFMNEPTVTDPSKKS